MAYTDDAVKAKLSALNETQESIVTVSQWILFHRRHADRTATIWLQKLREAGSSKRLNLIYLVNEVAQQSKARRKDDFINAFSPIIADASSIAYKGATHEVQQKLRRVIEVWRQRQIFDNTLQDAIEARVDEFDKSRSSGKKSLLSGSIFSSGSAAPAELQPLVALQIAVSKAIASSGGATSTADLEYDKLTDPSKTTPTPPVLAARLSALLKSLANAEGAVSQSIKARRALLEGLGQLVETNKIALTADETKHAELTNRKAAMEAKKREVEDGIVRGLSSDALSGPSASTPVIEPPGSSNGARDLHPQNGGRELSPREDLTPPPVESLTPVGSPRPATEPTGHQSQSQSQDQAPNIPSITQSQPHSQPQSQPAASTVGADLLSSLSVPPVRHYAGGGSGISGGGSAFKKRKLDGDFPGFGAGEDAMADLDADVAELLRAESGGGGGGGGGGAGGQ